MKHKTKWNNPFVKNTLLHDMQNIKALLLDLEKPITIVSDGGVHNYQGTFGLVISEGVRPLVKNKGKLYNVDFFESSFRSEIYAMLVALLTLEGICKDFGDIKDAQRTIHLYSDNKRVVQRIHNRRRKDSQSTSRFRR
jgi:hypothetical protein